MHEPVMNAARSEDRKTIRSAISSGRPNRRSGTSADLRRTSSRRSARCRSHEPPGKRMLPGATRVHAHVGRPNLAGEVLAVADESGLGSAVGQGRRRALKPDDRRDQDDAAVTGIASSPGEPADQAIGAREVLLEEALPVGLLEVPADRTPTAADVGHEAVRAGPSRSPTAASTALDVFGMTAGRPRRPSAGPGRTRTQRGSRLGERGRCHVPVITVRQPSARNARAVARPMPRDEPATRTTLSSRLKVHAYAPPAWRART